jgi:CHAT domain-containing protein
VDGRRVRLLDELVVRYAPSARLLSIARAAAGRPRRGPEALAAVGNPLPHPWPLEFARPEAEAVAALSPGPRLLLEREATRAALLEALPGAAHVHLACHGRFDPGDPLRSGVELADGTLSLRELLDGRALEGVRLVALSACQTAVTEFRRVPDEAVGLPTACLRAGAAGVVSTLWSVADASTALLMVRFWELRLGRGGAPPADPAAALRHAQRWLRDATAGELRTWARGHLPLAPVLAELEAEPADARPYADPLFWAPFTFVGA